MKRNLAWLYPGMMVKRWAILALLGLTLFFVGMGVRLQAHSPESRALAQLSSAFVRVQPDVNTSALGLLMAVFGALLCMVGSVSLLRSVIKSLDPDASERNLAETVYQNRKLTQGKKIVVIGGGTGLSTMLRGLKQHSANLTAIVTVADDGGSSGKIVKQLNMLPPGDIRNCLVALADNETQMTELFQYRFGKSVQPESALSVVRTYANGGTAVATQIEPEVNFGEGLRDHAFGNLLIAAMCAINQGDFKKAVQETSRVLNVRGQVLPSTVERVTLCAEMEGGSTLEGETTIAASPLKIQRMALLPETAHAPEEAISAIEEADLIVIGPGSLYTSLIPNLLVNGIPEAIRRSKAKKVYVCNVMTQPGETGGYSLYDHINALETHARQRIFDYVIYNTGEPSREILERYRKSGADLVNADMDRVKRGGYRPIPGNFINQSDLVRHDSALLAKAIINLVSPKQKR